MLTSHHTVQPQPMLSCSQVEGKVGHGGAAGMAKEDATFQQMSLLQGAIVQLNGEVNTLKLAVPQVGLGGQRH